MKVKPNVKTHSVHLLKKQQACAVPVAFDKWVIYTGGACLCNSEADNVHAGWGAAVYVSRGGVETEWMRLHGPVVLNPSSCNWIGAHRATNNTGELSAITEALIWVNQEAQDDFDHDVEIVCDSKYAAWALQGCTTRPRSSS